MTNPQPIQARFKLLGYIWRKDTDDVIFTIQREGHSDIEYAEIPTKLAALRAEAKYQGVSLGDLCDTLNAALTEREDEQRRKSGIPYAEWKFALNEDQAQAFAEMLGIEW